MILLKPSQQGLPLWIINLGRFIIIVILNISQIVRIAPVLWDEWSLFHEIYEWFLLILGGVTHAVLLCGDEDLVPNWFKIHIRFLHMLLYGSVLLGGEGSGKEEATVVD